MDERKEKSAKYSRVIVCCNLNFIVCEKRFRFFQIVFLTLVCDNRCSLRKHSVSCFYDVWLNIETKLLVFCCFPNGPCVTDIGDDNAHFPYLCGSGKVS